MKKAIMILVFFVAIMAVCLQSPLEATAASISTSYATSASKITITTQPETAKEKVGDTVKYTVKATGKRLKYQWQSSSDGKTWKNCSSSTAKKATFTFSAKTSHSNNYYRCKITDSNGNVVYTKAVRLYILNITTQPKTAKVEVGEKVTYKVAATGAGKTYQWQVSADGKTWKNCSSSTAKKATFTFSAKTSHNSNYYRCRIKDSGGNVVYTNAVRLYVLGVTKQPAAKTVEVGKSVKLTVSATGAGKTYQWQSSSNGTSWKNCSSSSATKATFTFTAKEKHNGNYYRCKISDNAGNVVYTNMALLTVKFDEITITGPTGEVYGYVDNARNYLLDKNIYSRRVEKYRVGTQKSAVKPVNITWTSNFAADSFTIRYGTDANLADAKEITASGSMNSVSVYNLFKSTTYYVEISAKTGSGKTVVGKSSFTTSSIGPRVMNIDSLYNVRDIGGYKTVDGKVTKQGMIFRGDALKPCAQSTANLSEAGKAYMSQELGIKLEIDFRTPAEAQYYDTASIIPGARLEYITISAYGEIFNNSNQIARIFKLMADEKNYPIYMHCTGGADRTGTVAYLLNALLGVSEKELIEDYEFTTFSIYETRSTYNGIYSGKFMGLEDKVYTYAGKNLSERAEACLLSIGVTQEEINSIKTIMKG